MSSTVAVASVLSHEIEQIRAPVRAVQLANYQTGGRGRGRAPQDSLFPFGPSWELNETTSEKPIEEQKAVLLTRVPGTKGSIMSLL